MIKEDLDRIMAMTCTAIIAPAGHGKTEMIADIVEYSNGKQLLLTHTNAGVDALEKRLRKREISKDKYTILTIAAFCIKWCVSYPGTASFDITLSPLCKGTQNLYYEQLYLGTAKVFENKWAGSVLSSSYSSVIVDEYQDCTKTQHEIILSINKFLPVHVLGDPLQGIFDWAGPLVDWNALEIPVVEVATKPWRWEKTNPALGAYLKNIRTQLLPAISGISTKVNIVNCDNYIEIISSDSFNGYKLLGKLNRYSSVLYLAKFENEQLSFSRFMSGIFQNDEIQECDILFNAAQRFDQTHKNNLALAILDFAESCATHVKKETMSYRNNLLKSSMNFSRIHKHLELGHMLSKICETDRLEIISDVIKWFQEQICFKVYRKELFAEMRRSIKYALDNRTTVFEAVNHVRRDRNLQKRYSQFKYLSSRTVLSKGLEFDCVIIDMRDPLKAKDFYVAITRAKKMVYIISDTDTFTLYS